MGYGLAGGLAEALQSEQHILHDEHLADRQQATNEQRNAAEVQSVKDANARANEMQPGALKQQEANLDSTTTNTAGAKQAQDQSAKLFPDELKIKHYQYLQDQLGLNDHEMLNLHNAGLATTKALTAQLSHGGAVDTTSLESMFNEGAPAGHRMKPGTLSVTPGKSDADTQISYVGDDGRPHLSSLQNWKDMNEAFMPPKSPVVLSEGQAAFDATTHEKLFGNDTGGPGLSKISPTTWTNDAYNQIARNYGAVLSTDAEGHTTVNGLTNDTADKVGRLAAVAGEIGKDNGYNIPTSTVAASVKRVYDRQSAGGAVVDETSPAFKDAVRTDLGIGNAEQNGYGAFGQKGDQQADGAHPTPEAPKDPAQRTEGTVYNTPKGPMKWTAAGWLPQSP